MPIQNWVLSKNQYGAAPTVAGKPLGQVNLREKKGAPVYGTSNTMQYLGRGQAYDPSNGQYYRAIGYDASPGGGFGSFLKAAAPLALSFVPGVGTALGAALGATTAAGQAALGGAVLGAGAGALGGGGVKGALQGAALGGVGGYVSGSGGLAGAAENLGLGTTAMGPPTAAGQYAAGTGSGVAGAIQKVGSGLNYVQNLVGAAPSGAQNSSSNILSGIMNPTGGLTSIGNLITAYQGAQTAKDAASIQAAAADRARAENAAINAPYTQLGGEAVRRIQNIQSNPAAYIQNNPFYQSLASDAERRLLANQAAKGKVGSGETAAALQEQLLNLGQGLVNQDINRLTTQAGIGAGTAGSVGATNADLLTSRGASQAAGKVGAYGAYKEGYQNQINTLLALQNLNRTPLYRPQG